MGIIPLYLIGILLLYQNSLFSFLFLFKAFKPLGLSIYYNFISLLPTISLLNYNEKPSLLSFIQIEDIVLNILRINRQKSPG